MGTTVQHLPVQIRARNIVIRPRVVVAHNEDNSDESDSADEEYQVANIVQQHWILGDHTNW